MVIDFALVVDHRARDLAVAHHVFELVKLGRVRCGQHDRTLWGRSVRKLEIALPSCHGIIAREAGPRQERTTTAPSASVA